MPGAQPMTRILVAVLLPALATAAHLHPEREYQEDCCNDIGGQMEVRLSDGTRVDCLTTEHAIEVDFAEKWTEGVGQALHYAQQTGKLPGILLILEKPGDKRHLRRLRFLSEEQGITVWAATVLGETGIVPPPHAARGSGYGIDAYEQLRRQGP